MIVSEYIILEGKLGTMVIYTSLQKDSRLQCSQSLVSRRCKQRGAGARSNRAVSYTSHRSNHTLTSVDDTDALPVLLRSRTNMPLPLSFTNFKFCCHHKSHLDFAESGIRLVGLPSSKAFNKPLMWEVLHGSAYPCRMNEGETIAFSKVLGLNGELTNNGEHHCCVIFSSLD